MADTYTGDQTHLSLPLGDTDVETTLPEDGDALDAASVRVAMEFEMDALDLLAEHDQGRALNFYADDTATSVYDTTSYTADAGGAFGVAVADCKVGDVLLVSGRGNASMNSTSDDGGLLGLFFTDNVGVGSETLITGSEIGINANATAGTYYEPVAWANALHVVTAAGTCRIRVKGKVVDADDDLSLTGGGSLTVLRLRGVVPVEG